MAVVRNLLIRAGADFSAMRNEMRRANRNLADFRSGVSRTVKGIGLALATLGIGNVIKNATKEAMMFEASIQQINRLLGKNAGEFQDWANANAQAFGMARSEAVKYGAVYANLLSSFTENTAKTQEYTQKLLKASAVVASSTGRTMQDTMERIRSGLLGNTEAIEDLGINVNVAMIEATDAFKRFANGKSWRQLDFRTQQQIRLFAILEQSAKKYGTEIANNTASRQAKFVAQLKNAQLALGQAFLPIYNIVLPALTAMAKALATAANYIAQFTQALFGKAETAKQQVKTTTAQAGAVTKLGDAYEKAGKQAKGSVAGFDEVHTLADSSAGSVAGSVASPAAALPAAGTSTSGSAFSGLADSTVKVSQKVKDMVEKIKQAFREMAGVVRDNKDIILAALAGIAAGFATFYIASKWGAIIAALKKAFTIVRGAIIAIGALIGTISLPILLIAAGVAALVGAFVYFYRTNEKFRGVVDGILRAIGDAAVWLWKEVIVPLGKWLADVFVKSWEAVSKAAKWLWKNVLVPTGDFILWFWNNVIKPVGKALGDVLGVAFDDVADIAKSFWKNVLVPLGDFFKETFHPAVEALSAVFKFLWEKVLKPLSDFVSEDMKPVWEGLTDVIVYLLEKVLKPIVKYVGGKLKTVFNTVFEGIGGVIDGLKTTFIGIMEFITGVFTGDWRKAWEGVGKIFKGVFDSLYAIVKTPLNLIIDAINTVIAGVNKLRFTIPDLPGIPGGGKTFGIHINPIPHLKNGGITNGPMMAMIGDNPGGREVVSPLDDLQDIIASAVSSAMVATKAFSGNNDKEISLQVDGVTFARLLHPYTTKESKRIGGSMIKTT